MKLRIKVGTTRKSIDLQNGTDTTLQELKTEVASELGLQQEDFEVSLNGSDSLEGSDKSLLEFGLVSGDLVFIILKNTTNLETFSEQPKRKPYEFPSTSQQFVTKDDMMNANMSPEVADSIEMKLEQDENNVVIISKCLNEPLLCRESTLSSIPPLLQELYLQTLCENKNDALWIVIHTLMLESGFVHIQQSDGNDSKSMPIGWKGTNHYTGEYHHIDLSQDVSCKLIGLPMGSKLIVHGQVSGSFETKQIHLKADDYISTLHTDGSKCYKNLHRLSLLIKDSIALPLLQELNNALGLPQVFGFLGLNFELKLKILTYLDCASLLRFGEVSKQMNSIYKDPYLWRRLYISTFGGRSNTNLSQDWLEIYKQKYKTRKEFYKRMQQSTIVSPSYSWHQQPRPYPPFAPIYPNHGIIGGDYDLNPQFPGVIDPLSGRRPRSGLEILRPRYDPIGPIPDPGLLQERRNPTQQHWFGRAMGNKFF